MHNKNIFLSSVKESSLLVWRHKGLFFILFVLQIIFFAVLSLINLTYQARILDSIQAITNYLAKQRLDDISVSSNLVAQKNILGDDPLLISRNFNSILRYFRLYMIYTFMLLTFFISLSWTITNKLVHKMNVKQFFKLLLKNFAVLLFYLGLIFVFFLSLVDISLTGISSDASKLFEKYVPFLIFSIVLVYFMYVSLALTHCTQLKNIIQKTLGVGIRKIKYILGVYFLNIFLLAVSIALIYLFIDNFPILFISMILMIFSLIFDRIFMVKVVENLIE